MVSLLPPRPHDRRQRAFLAGAGLISLVVASSMFFALTALTAEGADYGCGPAAFALLAGPSAATEATADCRTAAAKRLTTVSGLIALTMMGGVMAARLLPGAHDEPRHDIQQPGHLPEKRARQPRAPQRRHPYAGMEN